MPIELWKDTIQQMGFHFWYAPKNEETIKTLLFSFDVLYPVKRLSGYDTEMFNYVMTKRRQLLDHK